MTPDVYNVLLIDDDPLVLRAIARMLRPHVVTTLDDPLLALVQLDAGADYDVILCDMVMVRRSGIELFAQVIAIRPELAERFIFLTGNGTNEIETFLERPDIRAVRKPFVLQVLREAVEAVGRTSRGEKP